MNAEISASTDIDPSEFEAHAYSALAGAVGANSLDSRGSGIEVQSNRPIPLLEAACAVILPGQFADSKLGVQARALGVEVLSYRTTSRSRPNEYTGLLNDICMNYYGRTGILDLK